MLVECAESKKRLSALLLMDYFINSLLSLYFHQKTIYFSARFMWQERAMSWAVI